MKYLKFLKFDYLINLLKKLLKIKQKYSQIPSFIYWLKNHNSDLPVELELNEKKKNYLSFRFTNIISDLEIVINDYEIMVCALYEDEMFDIISDIDIYVQQNKNGSIFCSQCEKEHLKFYENLSTLYVEHNFEPFLKWAIQNIQENNYLALYQIEGARWAKILKLEDFQNEKFDSSLVMLKKLQIEKE